MENNDQMQNIEAQEGCTLLCAPPCNGAVCISRARYDKLIRAESELGILRRAYQTMNSFSMDYIMDIVFDSALKYNPKATPAPTLGTEDPSTGSASDAE